MLKNKIDGTRGRMTIIVDTQVACTLLWVGTVNIPSNASRGSSATQKKNRAENILALNCNFDSGICKFKTPRQV